MSTLEDKLAEYARYATPAYIGADKEDKSNKYYEYKNKYEKARREYSDLMDEKAKTRPKPSQIKRTFVNSYGEATTRTIESLTYKRQQKRINKQILRNLGVK